MPKMTFHWKRSTTWSELIPLLDKTTGDPLTGLSGLVTTTLKKWTGSSWVVATANFTLTERDTTGWYEVVASSADLDQPVAAYLIKHASIKDLGLSIVTHVRDIDTVLRANVEQIAGDANAASNLDYAMDTITICAAVTGTLTTTQTSTDLTETTTDFWAGKLMSVATGSVKGERVAITAYNGTTKVLTHTALSSPLSDSDVIVIH